MYQAVRSKEHYPTVSLLVDWTRALCSFFYFVVLPSAYKRSRIRFHEEKNNTNNTTAATATFTEMNKNNIEIQNFNYPFFYSNFRKWQSNKTVNISSLYLSSVYAQTFDNNRIWQPEIRSRTIPISMRNKKLPTNLLHTNINHFVCVCACACNIKL